MPSTDRSRPASPAGGGGTSTEADLRRARLAALLQAGHRPVDPTPRLLHRRFEDRARAHPDAVAVSCEGRSLTYSELDRRASALACRLRAAGVGPESLVGLAAERSPEMIVGILAILKAGGAYLPLDPVYPAKRLALVLEDSGARTLLTQDSLQATFPDFDGMVVPLSLEDEAPEIRMAADAPGLESPDQLAYVIYTSGSTGTPKGVGVSHANVDRLFTATRHWFRFERSDVWTLFHSFAFDFSVWEIWGALLHGGRLVVVPYWVSRSPDSFLELLRDEGVTVLNQTPSAFRQLIRADEAAGSPGLSLRHVIFGGEALELQSLRPWFDRHGDERPRLVNMYGITETTVHVTHRPITRSDLEEHAGSSPIGEAIPDLRTFVLDPNLRPVPPGAVGEIFVGGEGVARGYLNRSGLTAERFVPDPFSGKPGARLYRSGDLARRRRDGSLDYLGRSDRQVKVRGFRIELGEIEAALARQPELHDAAVVAVPGPEGEARLAAYVVPRTLSAPSAESLRERLLATLPDYMVPAVFVSIERLPLTANGKLDTASLPEPGDGAALPPAEYVAPATALEEQVAAVWRDVLGGSPIGASDNFFLRGGHSLLAAQAIARLRQATGLDVPLRALFEAPTVRGLAGRMERLQAAGHAAGLSPIPTAPRDGEIPLSFSQQALWFLDRLSPGTPAFNVTAAVTIRGPLDVAALGRSFREIAARHESLRTRFPAVDGRPVQLIEPLLDLPLAVDDLEGIAPDGSHEAARRLAIEEGRTPFDLAKGPLVRARLIRIREGEHVVLLTMHHIVTDGWSMGVAAKELAAIYEAFTEGRESPLPPPAIQYADYAAWQRASLAGDRLDRLVAFWRKELDGLAPLQIPTDRPRPAVRTARGDVHFFELPAALTASLRSLAKAEDATLFMTLLAGFQALLSRYTGQDDVAVGVPVANRGRPEVEDLVGYFVNMIVMRSRLADDPGFRAFVRRVRDTSIAAFEHQELPFDRLVEALQPRRDPSRTPLFDVMFVLQNNRMPDASRRELTLGSLDVGEGTGAAKFDLTLAMVEDGDHLSGSIEFNADLFDAPTIERMIGHFGRLLESAVTAPDARVSELTLSDAAERSLMLRDWNATAAPLPECQRLHRLIEDSARRFPDAEALEQGYARLSYRELNARANQLARLLRSRGIGREDVVAFRASRSVDAVTSLLAILKAGSAFLPIDPEESPVRMARMLRDCGSRTFLSIGESKAQSVPDGVEVLAVDFPAGAGACVDGTLGENLEDEGGPEDAAYVLFTSGSTGTPRGVVVSHRSVVNHATAAVDLYAIAAADRVLQFSPLHFDIAVEELFPTWLAGGCVVLRDGDETLDPRAFTDWIAERGITVLDLPTAYWHSWTEYLARRGRGPGGHLRLVIVGGERALPSALGAWRRVARDGIRWINTYGPTEATVIATSFDPGFESPDSRDEDDDIPIGSPIRNTAAYVLDDRMQPVPLGIPGELYIGGEGVARGYVGLAAETARRFVPDPFSKRPGARLFRTGDLVRWRGDGRLAFVGRRDIQVKVQGFRVEPGEVESALRQHPEVRDAAVVAVAGEGQASRLVAYVVAIEGSGPTADSFAAFLRERLPRYMITSRFALVDSLPLTSSGKVDRRRLAARDLEVAAPAAGDEFTAPRDEIEAKLASIWEEELGVRPVGVHASFFDLGGHSLLAIRMLSRIEAELGRELPLSALFLAPTIAGLADSLRDPRPSRPGSPIVSLHAGGASRRFFCVHPAGGVVYCFLELARRLGPDLGLEAFQASGLNPGESPLSTIEEMADRYIRALRETQPSGPYLLGGYSLGGVVAFEMARRLRDSGEAVERLVMIDAGAPSGPPRLDAATLDLGARAAKLALFRDALDVDDEAEAARRAATILAYLGGGGLGMRRLLKRLSALPPDAQRHEALQLFALDTVYREGTRPERARGLWRVLASSLLALSRYRPEPDGIDVLLFRASKSKASDQTLGWIGLASSVEVRHVTGDHATLLTPPGVDELAGRLLQECGMRPVSRP
ncbi:Linear gramicidin synthase subunit D [Aquisphaera giovannonii]|uniref:Linear gramicidin synthase subunit D n=1 Tax=Aquisphaera giovannonii TaxID=406548 RepID=A0A5B9W8E9_9BACT|nr:non-ribosomal peptide synthetase [Aquisphaera giovannonii]QEH36902.1 Linear gramicidin synthase subunit D [Aquisphaera giovannonii]